MFANTGKCPYPFCFCAGYAPHAAGHGVGRNGSRSENVDVGLIAKSSNTKSFAKQLTAHNSYIIGVQRTKYVVNNDPCTFRVFEMPLHISTTTLSSSTILL